MTHHNAPHQTVVGGRTGDLSEFAERLTAEGFKCQPLRVPGALHSPMVKAAQEPFRQALTREKLCPPTKLFYSNVSRDQISRSDDFVTNLVDQLVEPLDYPALIDRLLAEGVGALVEVGPGQVLTRLHRQIVGEDIVCTGTDHARRSAWEQLERARVALECVGAVPDRGGMPIFAPAVPRQIAEFDATSVRRQRRRSESAAAQSDRSAHPEPEPGSDSTLARLPLDYVVDLTGYPRDAISLDWDLEADLGIDSIKRMQLIGELAEVLGLETAAEAQTTLTGLHTLRELLDYLENSETAGDGTPSAPNAEDRAL